MSMPFYSPGNPFGGSYMRGIGPGHEKHADWFRHAENVRVNPFRAGTGALDMNGRDPKLIEPWRLPKGSVQRQPGSIADPESPSRGPVGRTFRQYRDVPGSPQPQPGPLALGQGGPAQTTFGSQRAGVRRPKLGSGQRGIGAGRPYLDADSWEDDEIGGPRRALGSGRKS